MEPSSATCRPLTPLSLAVTSLRHVHFYWDLWSPLHINVVHQEGQRGGAASRYPPLTRGAGRAQPNSKGMTMPTRRHREGKGRPPPIDIVGILNSYHAFKIALARIVPENQARLRDIPGTQGQVRILLRTEDQWRAVREYLDSIGWKYTTNAPPSAKTIRGLPMAITSTDVAEALGDRDRQFDPENIYQMRRTDYTTGEVTL